MKRLALAALLSLAACASQPTDQPANDATMTPLPAPDATPKPVTTAIEPAPVATAQPGKLPPADRAEPRFIGRWAATVQLCSTGAWRFYATHLETAGEVSCSYHRVDTVPGGYDLHASCTAEGPPQPDVVKLRFAESAQAMLVDSKMLKSVGLTYCGPLKE